MTGSARRLRVLLVDDDPLQRILVRRLVDRTEGMPWEWREAASGRAALDALDAWRPHCVLIDYRLPDHDGLELLRRIVRRGDPDVAVVMLTGHGDERVAAAAMRQGAQDYLTKDSISGHRIRTSVSAALERKCIQHELHRRNAQFHRVLDALTAVLVAVDQEDRVTNWSPRAATVLGAPAELAVGRRLFDLDLRWDAGPVAAAVARCRESRRPETLPAVPLEREGERAGLLEVQLSLMDLDGESGVLLVATDVTEIRELQRHLAQAQKLEAIGQLAAGIAHEINTPTQFVSDNTCFLKESCQRLTGLLEACAALAEAPDEEARRAAAERVTEVVKEVDVGFLLEEIPSALDESLAGLERISRIVRAMKAFSHPGSGGRELADLNAAVRNTVIVARNEWKYVAEVETDLDPALPHVPCFVGEMNQVVLNMIVNAVHAIEGVVDRAGGEKGRIRVSTRARGDHVEIRVSDTGTGIPEAIRDRIFDPFFTTKEVGKGTGQGLAIAHDVVVNKHGGSIRVESESGVGTTFVVRLPLDAEGAAAA